MNTINNRYNEQAILLMLRATGNNDLDRDPLKGQPAVQNVWDSYVNVDD